MNSCFILNAISASVNDTWSLTFPNKQISNAFKFTQKPFNMENETCMVYDLARKATYHKGGRTSLLKRFSNMNPNVKVPVVDLKVIINDNNSPYQVAGTLRIMPNRFSPSGEVNTFYALKDIQVDPNIKTADLQPGTEYRIIVTDCEYSELSPNKIL